MNRAEQKFVGLVWDYYRAHGRHTLPWRMTIKPYRIIVSELMLQQTQVDRVIPKYKAFIKKFPSVSRLAEAPLAEVLTSWQGLGYNRRAKLLHECAKRIVREHAGTVPSDRTELLALPGIGPYTASAVLAFAYNVPTVMIETNIRAAYIHFFFEGVHDVTDAELLPHIERTLDASRSQEWYAALMDYGSMIKKVHGNPNVRSTYHVRQKSFAGSDRQIRGAIIRELTQKPRTRTYLESKCSDDMERLSVQLARLTKEGMVVKKGRTYRLPDT